LIGGDGNDELTGGGGKDYLYGGAGADSFYFDKNDTGNYFSNAGDIIYDFEDKDQIYLTGVKSYTISSVTGGNLITWTDGGFHDIFVKGDNPTGDITLIA
jgi:Ca2+-binding RTX toxin-like protein